MRVVRESRENSIADLRTTAKIIESTSITPTTKHHSIGTLPRDSHSVAEQRVDSLGEPQRNSIDSLTVGVGNALLQASIGIDHHFATACEDSLDFLELAVVNLIPLGFVRAQSSAADQVCGNYSSAGEQINVGAVKITSPKILDQKLAGLRSLNTGCSVGIELNGKTRNIPITSSRVNSVHLDKAMNCKNVRIIGIVIRASQVVFNILIHVNPSRVSGQILSWRAKLGVSRNVRGIVTGDIFEEDSVTIDHRNPFVAGSGGVIDVLLFPSTWCGSLGSHVICARSTSSNVVIEVPLGGILQFQDILSTNNGKVEIVIVAGSPFHIELHSFVDLPMGSVRDSGAAGLVSGSLVV